MDIDDERTASPVSGDASDWPRTHANFAAGKAANGMRSDINDSQRSGLHAGRNARDDNGIRSFFASSDDEQAGQHTEAEDEPAFVSGYFRENLPAISLVCLAAAAIGVLIGIHFAAEPNGQATVPGSSETHLRQSRMMESPASPSDMMMQRIEEMRKIAAEDATDEVPGAAGPGNAASAVERTSQGAEQDKAASQPASGSQSSRACSAASVALALCDH